uniref:Putative secreted protein n=1 Tax=Anopheles darlingi TaxID=43151 RepID=A0A2M4DN51_ANODA
MKAHNNRPRNCFFFFLFVGVLCPRPCVSREVESNLNPSIAETFKTQSQSTHARRRLVVYGAFSILM